MSNPNRRIQLAIATQTVYSGTSTQGYRLTITASNGNLMDDNIFFYLYIPPQGSYVSANILQGVCNPSQLLYLPIGAPDSTSPDPATYRLNTVDITYPVQSLATSGLNDILTAINQLKAALDFTDGLSTTDYWIGSPPS